MTYAELGFHAQEIYEMAVEKYLRDEYLIYEHDGLYYGPSDPMSGMPMMTEEVLRKTVRDTEMKFQLWTRARANIDDIAHNDYSAESVEGVIDKAKQGINDLTAEVERAEQKIVDAMTNSGGVVSGHSTDFLAPRPTLAGQQGQQGQPPTDPDVGRPHDD